MVVHRFDEKIKFAICAKSYFLIYSILVLLSSIIPYLLIKLSQYGELLGVTRLHNQLLFRIPTFLKSSIILPFFHFFSSQISPNSRPLSCIRIFSQFYPYLTVLTLHNPNFAKKHIPQNKTVQEQKISRHSTSQGNLRFPFKRR